MSIIIATVQDPGHGLRLERSRIRHDLSTDPRLYTSSPFHPTETLLATLAADRYTQPSVNSRGTLWDHRAYRGLLGDFACALTLSFEEDRGDKLKVVLRSTGFIFNGEGRGISFVVHTNVAARNMIGFLVLVEEASRLHPLPETFSLA